MLTAGAAVPVGSFRAARNLPLAAGFVAGHDKSVDVLAIGTADKIDLRNERIRRLQQLRINVTALLAFPLRDHSEGLTPLPSPHHVATHAQ
jgi:hypothetical protein